MRNFRPTVRARQRGVSLIEALMAFAVMALGMLGVMGVQTTLRFNSDIAKQRSEATRLAQEQMEKLRAFSVLETTAGRAAYDDIVTASADVEGYTTNTAYSVTTTAQEAADSKNVTTLVTWMDRQGEPQTVELHSVIAGIDPGLSGTLSLPPNGSPHRARRNRHGAIPFDAEVHREGRHSLFSPQGQSGNVHWVFNNTSGIVTRVCTSRNGNQVVESTCTATSGLLVSGVVRFDTDGQVSAGEAENPVSSPAFDVDMTLSLPGAEFQCFDDAPTTPTGAIVVRYQCLVLPTGNDIRWSGTLNLVLAGGRTIGTTQNDFRVCRYSADYNGRDGIENLEHPRAYSGVTGPLTNQNFLVIRGDNDCPRETLQPGDLVNSSTVEHQPNPAS